MKGENGTQTDVNKTGYKILLDQHFEDKQGRRYSLDFKITSPASSNPDIVRVDYTPVFRPYYPRPNDSTVNQRMTTLIWWGWLKIKEMIGQNNILNQVTMMDTNWARSVEKQIDQNICSQIQGDGYLYSPQRKMGFRP